MNVLFLILLAAGLVYFLFNTLSRSAIFSGIDVTSIAYPICVTLYVISALTLFASLFLVGYSLTPTSIEYDSDVDGTINNLFQLQCFYSGIIGLVSGTLIAATATMLHVLIETMNYASQTSVALTKLTRKRK